MGGLPALSSVFKNPDLVARLPYWRQELTSLSQAKSRPRIPQWGAIADILQDDLSRALAKSTPPQKALADAQTRVEARSRERYRSPTSERRATGHDGGASDDRRSANSARSRRPRSKRQRVAMAFQIPSLVLLVGVVAFPLGYTLWLSFRSYSLVIPGRTGQWIGLGNFDRLLHDSQFHHALELTGLYTVIAVAIEVVLGIAAAFALNAVRRGRRVLTSLMLIPMILAPLIIGLMFNFLLNAQFGLFTYLVDKLGLPFPRTSWEARPGRSPR